MGTINSTEESVVKAKRFNIKTFIKIFCCLLVIWLIISAYYYKQHCYSLKTFTIDKELKVGNSFFYVEEAKLQNLTSSINRLGLYDWQIAIANKLPQSLYFPFLNVCYFYSTPYEIHYSDTSTLRVSGVMYTEFDWSRPDYPVEIFDESGNELVNGQRLSSRSISKVSLIEVRANDYSSLDIKRFTI
ncbi:MAG: hypothetical protein FH758_10245 [Firmicutes bacterium]|nr:hypothetical protein [Bacillota bacterium]